MESSSKQPLPRAWMKALGQEFNRPYMLELKQFLQEEIAKGKTIYPHGSQIFSAFWKTDLDQVKVVIIGQDPYHGPGQANGQCFSVPEGIRIPPSLVNIYQEIAREYQTTMPKAGDLSYWADQGVLLLNATLTVEAHRPLSHAKRGWEQFTDRVVEILNSECQGLVFLLWGSHAQKKAQNVDRQRHLVLESPHPSPLSAYRGFLGNNHFCLANKHLKHLNKKEIDWSFVQKAQ